MATADTPKANQSCGWGNQNGKTTNPSLQTIQTTLRQKATAAYLNRFPEGANCQLWFTALSLQRD
jgi:hypothetical protein